MTTPDSGAQYVIDALDGFYCHNVVVALWADAVANRLEGMAVYLLGGAVTADPRELLDRAPGGGDFTIPDCSDPYAIVGYARQRLEEIIAAYQAFLDAVRGQDDVSFALVVKLLAAETRRRADAVAAMAQPAGSR